MSRQTVDIATRLYEQIIREVERYWEAARSFASAAAAGALVGEAAEVFEQLHPDVRWTNVTGEIYEGKIACMKGIDELLQAAQAWTVRLDEVADLGEDQVLVVLHSEMRGQSSGAVGALSLFTLVTVRGGLVFRTEEFLGREEALRAATPAR